MESDEVNTLCRQEGRKFSEQILRFKNHGCGSIPPWTFQLIKQPFIR